MTLTAELNQKAKAILIRELGPVDYTRFIQQYEEGLGNYTEDRHQWLGSKARGPCMNRRPNSLPTANSSARSGQNYKARTVEHRLEETRIVNP
jgi:hypothetical protein